MGIYIQVPVRLGKAEWLIQHLKAVEVDLNGDPPSPHQLAGKILVCVVSNPTFEVAAIMFDANELADWTLLDHSRRPKCWLLMDEAIAYAYSDRPDPKAVAPLN